MYGSGFVPAENLNGWFPLFRSNEVGLCQIKGVHAFERDLVVFRSSSGKVHVMDAYCPHMGTYFPVGGKVVDESIRCPFHGWTFNGKGECTHVPGLEASNLPKTNIKTWNSIEVNGFICIWYHFDNEPPQWQPNEHKGLEKLKYAGKFTFIGSGHFTEFPYNIADLSHFVNLHSAPSIVDPISLYHQNWYWQICNKILFSKFEPKWERLPEKHMFRAFTYISLLFCGFPIVTDLAITITYYGPYLTHWSYTGGLFDLIDMESFCALTPIPGRKFSHIMYSFCKPTLFAKIASNIIHYYLKSQLIRDSVLWTNKKLLKNPAYTLAEKDLVECTRFLNQFTPKDKALKVGHQTNVTD